MGIFDGDSFEEFVFETGAVGKPLRDWSE